MANAPASQINVHLSTPDWTARVALSVPAGREPLQTWLPFLHILASNAAEAAEKAAEDVGKQVSCRKGCGACCRQLVAISLVEARALAMLVAEMPEPRRGEIRGRFAAAMARVGRSGLLERDFSSEPGSAAFPLAETAEQRLGAAWFTLSVACPFLEDESCSIHEQRPLVCREYQVTSPASACARLYREPVERIESSVRLGQSLARATAKIAGVSVAMIPLVMALDLPADVGAALSEPRDVVEMLQTLLGEIGDWRIEPRAGEPSS